MYHIWVLDMRAQPPVIVAHAESNVHNTIKKCAQVLADTWSGPQYTLVHEVNAEPLGIAEYNGI